MCCPTSIGMVVLSLGRPRQKSLAPVLEQIMDQVLFMIGITGLQYDLPRKRESACSTICLVKEKVLEVRPAS
jgi:hypothetical protein